ncbi:LOG family protein [Candidatus Latescibacterota bacterium]
MKQSKNIAVFGSSRPLPGSAQYENARIIGRAVAESGWTVVTGGYNGTMEAASKGAKEAGGSTIGVTTDFLGRKGLTANEYVDSEIHTPEYGNRLMKLCEISDGYIIMRGGTGTLTELFFSWELEKKIPVPPKPIVLFGDHWPRIIDFLAEELPDEYSFSRHLDLLAYTEDPGQAVEIIRAGLSRKTGTL